MKKFFVIPEFCPHFTMKFRGRMIEQMSIRKFYSVIMTMAKIAKTCVMRLTADKVVADSRKLNKS